MGLLQSKESNNEEVEIDNAELKIVVEENNVDLPEEELKEEVKEEVEEEGIVSKILNSFKLYQTDSSEDSSNSGYESDEESNN